MRVCFLGPGSSIHTRRWVDAASNRGHEVLLVATDPAAVAAEVFDPYRDMGWLGTIPKVRAFIAERRILSRVREFSPDIVHLHWLNPCLGTARLAARLEPLVVSVWGRDVMWDGPDPEPMLRALWKRRILGRAAHVTATSQCLAERTRPWLPPGTPLSIVPFGVDCALFRPREDRSVPAIPVIGFLKHYTPKYGAEVLLEAAARLASRGIEFRLEMYGTLDPQPYRRMLAGLRGLERRAVIHGPVEHRLVPSIMSRFDIFAMPSIHDSETFGVAALEASACGIPVVASRVGGVPEVVTDGVTGVLVKAGDPDALAAALERLVLDPALRSRLGSAGRADVLARYEWSVCVDRMEAVYTRITGVREATA